ncbi:cytochrome c3 family protein [bacterium]|nr:cytochrome c3 family protein [bacterium]
MAAAGALVFMATSGYVNAQFDKVEGVEAPDDVTGADCTMCHGDAATKFEFHHQPAFEGKCTTCHLETGTGGHGGLTMPDRQLCLQCHQDQEQHYPLATCWTSACHSDIHGSNVDATLNPSRQEAYPGFFEATTGAEYTGSEACLTCHTDQCSSWKESMHSLSDTDWQKAPNMRGCESCHGPGGNHWGRKAGIGSFAYASDAESDAVCLTCHKDETFAPEYQRNTHVKTGVGCVDCHDVHSQLERHNLRASANELCLTCHQNQRLEFAKFSHHPVDDSDARTGLQCVECHNPHGGEGRAMLVANQDELCFVCHVDKQGPFIYAHAGYEAGLGQGCSTCHDSHGSNSPNLLKMSGRGLCIQCHTDRVQHFPAQTCWSTGCHSDHHGSNTDYFFFDN